MSLRFVFWVAILAIGCAWMLRRPLVGVCLNVLFFPINPALWGTGLEFIRFQFIAMLCLLFSCVVNRRSLCQPDSKDARPIMLLLCYTLWSVAACVWAVGSKADAWEQALSGCKLAVFVWLIPRVVATEVDLKAVAWAIFISFGLKAALDRWGRGYSPTGLTVGFEDAWYAMLVAVLVLVIACSRVRWERIIGALMIPVMLDAIVFLHRRSAFAALVGCGGVLIIGSPARHRWKVITGAAVAAALFVAVLTPAKYWDWTATILRPQEEASAASRFTLNAASWAMVRDYPMGVGPANYKYMSPRYTNFERPPGAETGKTAHNTFLSLLAERGWVGLGLWLSMFLLTWIRLLRISRSDPTFSKFRVVLARGFCLGMVGVLPALWTHVDSNTDLPFWIVGLGVVITRLHRIDQASSKPTARPSNVRGPVGRLGSVANA